MATDDGCQSATPVSAPCLRVLPAQTPRRHPRRFLASGLNAGPSNRAPHPSPAALDSCSNFVSTPVRSHCECTSSIVKFRLQPATQPTRLTRTVMFFGPTCSGLRAASGWMQTRKVSAGMLRQTQVGPCSGLGRLKKWEMSSLLPLVYRPEPTCDSLDWDNL
jgi:hypothetical protein